MLMSICVCQRCRPLVVRHRLRNGRVGGDRLDLAPQRIMLVLAVRMRRIPGWCPIRAAVVQGHGVGIRDAPHLSGRRVNGVHQDDLSARRALRLLLNHASPSVVESPHRLICCIVCTAQVVSHISAVLLLPCKKNDTLSVTGTNDGVSGLARSVVDLQFCNITCEITVFPRDIICRSGYPDSKNQTP